MLLLLCQLLLSGRLKQRDLQGREQNLKMGMPGVGRGDLSLQSSEKGTTSNFMGQKLLVWVITVCQIFAKTLSHINLIGQESLSVFVDEETNFQRQAASSRSQSQVIKLESYSAPCGWHFFIFQNNTYLIFIFVPLIEDGKLVVETETVWEMQLYTAKTREEYEIYLPLTSWPSLKAAL